MLFFNVSLVAAHFVVFALSGSHLVLAQGADSLMDVAVTGILAFSARVGAQPKDDNHPFGHGRAEPIGALVSAVLACVLTLEVGRSAIEAAIAHEPLKMDISVLSVLCAKFAVKSGFLIVLARRAKAEKSPAVAAVVADSVDLAATAACVARCAGYFAVRAGLPYADTLFALAICVYIARNGLGLFRENLRYLMGEAPDGEVVEQMRAAAAGVDGVHAVGNVAAHYVGSLLHVEVAVVVKTEISATQSHDIGERVQRAVEELEEVGRAFVHVDTQESAQ